MSLAPQLRNLAVEISSLELQHQAKSEMLDQLFDLHNDLTDWATNTDHAEAASQVMAILDKYTTRVKRNDETQPMLSVQ